MHKPHSLATHTFSEIMSSCFSVGSSQPASSFLASAIRTATVLEIFFAREPENVYCCMQFSYALTLLIPRGPAPALWLHKAEEGPGNEASSHVVESAF